MGVFAPAKINLFLHVGDKRSDGYHELQSLAVFATVGDMLTFGDATALSLSVAGPFAPALANEQDNLVLKAARALAERAGREPGARIELVKYLPVSAGLGGGSADAAAALRELSQLWDLKIAAADLRALGASLGSDIPVCIASVPAWMEGRGERLTPLSVPPLHFVLVNSGATIATADVYARLSRRSGTALTAPSGFADSEELFDFLEGTGNDLEAPAIALEPSVNKALVAVAASGARLARMSGSGATCFGLYESQNAAEMAAKAIEGIHPDWWVKAAKSASFSR